MTVKLIYFFATSLLAVSSLAKSIHDVPEDLISGLRATTAQDESLPELVIWCIAVALVIVISFMLIFIGICIICHRTCFPPRTGSSADDMFYRYSRTPLSDRRKIIWIV